MNTTLLERLRGFQLPSEAPLPTGHHTVARLRGVDFDGILDSPEFGFARPYDVRFGKMMIRTASQLLGGDACGRYGFTEQTEFSVLLEQRQVASRWTDACALQNFLVALASSRMSLQVEDEALFTCKLYSFSKSELVIAYFMWRQQEAFLAGLDRYCACVLSQDGKSPESVAKIMEGLGALEKEEILRQNNVEYSSLPAWQRYGAAVFLPNNGTRVSVDTNLPQEAAYRPYLQQHLD